MPIVFILLGVIVLYLLFYQVCIPHKKTLIVLIICTMIGFFIPYITILNGLLVNFFILIPLFIFDVYCIVQLGKLPSVLFLAILSVTSLIYVLIVIIDMEFSTVINPIYTMLGVVLISILLSRKVYFSLAYLISSLLLFDLLNLFLVKNSLGLVTLLSIEVYQGVLIGSLCVIVFYNILEIIQIKIKNKEKKKNV